MTPVEAHDSNTTSPLAVVQLSDFHFKDAQHPVLERAEAIVSGVISLMQPISSLFIVVTGDVAFSGIQAEYELADAFFRDLIEQCDRVFPGVETKLVFTPGNHDCDLRSPPDIRDYNLLRTKLSTLEPDGAIVLNCAKVQESYFAFAKRFGQLHENGLTMLANRLEFRAEGTRRIAFTSYNSAWLSHNPEKTGQLYIPDRAFRCPENIADVEIVLSHHPWTWLDPDNAFSFRSHLERTADLILSGHQHRGAEHRLEDREGNALYVIEGMAMYDPRARENGFNVVLIAPKEERWQLHSFVWDGARYVETDQDGVWEPFLRNKALEDGGFTCTADFKSRLIDPGVAFTHGGKRQIFLHDIFVYPDLVQRDVQRKVEDASLSSALVRSKNVLQWVYENKRILISGEDKAGRTALAKTLYRDLQREYKLVPLMLSVDDINSFRPQQIKDTLEAARREQYGPKAKESFFELPRGKRVLIVDDFQRSKLNRNARASLILNAELFFDFIIILVDETFDLEVLSTLSSQPLFGNYRQYTIADMGHQLRGKLIGRWVALRSDNWTNDDEAYEEALEKEKTIESLLSRRMLPSHPIIILGILQFLEASRNPHTNTGSYGELYQRLITDRLASQAKKPSDIGTWYTLLSRLAFSMFASERRVVSIQDFRAVFQRYYEEFKIHYDVDALCSNFIDAQILESRDGAIAFRYRDFYHFFVARYFDENLHDESEASGLRGRLQYMTERVYFEEYSGILIFYLYLAKDSDVIKHLVENAKRIYANEKPCDLDSQTKFLSKMYLAPPGPLSLPESDAASNRDAYRARMDELDRAGPPRTDGENLPYSDDLDDFIKINFALKSIYILGQVLRAFPGAIRQDTKTQIARECYLLGLRVLTFVVNTIHTHTEQLRQYFGAYIREQREVTRASEVPASADEVILNLAHAWAFGIIKKISESVGLSELDATYREVAEDQGQLLSVQFIDLSIRLDHYYEFPGDQVRSMHVRVRGNLFSLGILQNLVAQYFVLFRSTPALRAVYGKLLDIGTPKGLLLESGLAKTPEE